LKLRKGFFALLALIVVGVSCNKKADLVGLNLQPDDEQLQLVLKEGDGITTYSKLHDSVSAGNLSGSLIGGIFDPVFGVSQTSVSFEIERTTTGDMPTIDEVDSVVLVVFYNGLVYGDKSQEVTWYLHELNDTIASYSAPEDPVLYYSDTILEYNEDYIDSYTFVPNPDSTITIGESELDAHVRFPITNETFIQRLLDEDVSSTEPFEGRVLNGFHIRTDVPFGVGEGVVLGVKTRASAYMNLYYTDDNDELVSKRYDVSNSMNSVNHVQHFEYADAISSVRSQIIDGVTEEGNTEFYVQGGGGIQAFVELDGIEEWKAQLGDKKIAVNDARLVVKINNQDSDILPEELYIIRNDGEYVAEWEADIEGGSQYTFHITDYVQSILQGEVDYEETNLMIWVAGASQDVSGAAFGGENANDGITLQVIYSEL
jgi:hypothetical protein